jgi:hypothetical protein
MMSAKVASEWFRSLGLIGIGGDTVEQLLD